jgi:aldehyde:ferredoxin oxidoreductase
MMRAFNQREGFTRANDILPKKFFKPLQGEGPTAGVSLSAEELEGFKDSYYKMAEWDVATGNPTPKKLKALKLDWIEF